MNHSMTREQQIEILTVARDVVLCDESAWTQGAYARDAAGKEVLVDDVDAAAFCRVGAAWRAAHLLGFSPVQSALGAELAFPNKGDQINRNDEPGMTYSSTIDDFDSAIKFFEEQA